MTDHLICCIKGCDSPSLALGLCNKHWRRNKKYGSPVATKNHPGSFRGMSALDRFMGRINKKEHGCWEWQGAKDKDGYGIFKGEVSGRIFQKAHRFSYAYHNGGIPKGLHVCHVCDNPKCVNPSHLWLGTNADNQKDKHSKGRCNIPKGEDSAQAVLTKDQAQAILTDPRPYQQIAEDYAIKASTVGSIKNRAAWSNLEGNAVKAKRVSPRKGKSKVFTPEDIRFIRLSSITGKELAAQFNVTPATICDIRKRRSWAHIQ